MRGIRQETLDLLAKNRTQDSQFEILGTNHASMVMIALDKMGASNDVVMAYFKDISADWSTNKVRFHLQVTEENWCEHLAGEAVYGPYLKFFTEQIKAHGPDTVLKTYLPTLMKGCGAAAYHALIRLGFAIEGPLQEEIPFALAYWCETFVANPEFDCRGHRVTPREQFEILEREPYSFDQKLKGNIVSRMRRYFEYAPFAKNLKPIETGTSEPLKEMALLSAELFEKRGHFTLLHAVTSCHALRQLLPFLDHNDDYLSFYWHSICAAAFTVLQTDFSIPYIAVPARDWPEILALACQSGNEHTIKLAYTCFQEHACYGEEMYRHLASREIERSSPFR